MKRVGSLLVSLFALGVLLLGCAQRTPTLRTAAQSGSRPLSTSEDAVPSPVASASSKPLGYVGSEVEKQFGFTPLRRARTEEAIIAYYKSAHLYQTPLSAFEVGGYSLRGVVVDTGAGAPNLAPLLYIRIQDTWRLAYQRPPECYMSIDFKLNSDDPKRTELQVTALPYQGAEPTSASDPASTPTPPDSPSDQKATPVPSKTLEHLPLADLLANSRRLDPQP